MTTRFSPVAVPWAFVYLQLIQMHSSTLVPETCGATSVNPLPCLPATPLRPQPHLYAWLRPRRSFPILQASWFRLKYPHVVHGAIAASAPVLALEGLRRPIPDPEKFAETVTKAAGPAGGAAESCADNVRYAFSAMLPHVHNDSVVGKGGAKLRGKGDDVAGLATVADVARKLRVCAGQEPQGDDAIWQLAWWARSAFDYLAMGNFPYATGYILNSSDGVELPPWPLRKACSYLADPALQVQYDWMMGATECPRG